MRHALAALAVGLLVLSPAPSHAQSVTASHPLADFESGPGAFDPGKAERVDSPHLRGIALSLAKNLGVTAHQPKVDWTKFNFLRFEAFNPADAPARVHVVFADDSAPHGYYSWINRYLSVRPGKSTVELYLPELRRGESSPKDATDPRPFHWDKVQRLGLTSMSGELQLDDIRLDQVEFPREPGVLAFDFGPAASPVSPLCTAVTPDSAFADDAGFGWTNKGILFDRRRSRAPDTFVGDWISGQNSTFSVKFPDGAYRVWMLWEDPGEWEFYQNYTERSVAAEGKQVLKEAMDGKEFLDRYFHFAEAEDLPGDDIYARYLGWRYRPREFDVTVTDGRLDLTFHGSSQYAATVNGLVIYPADKADVGRTVIDAIQGWRKHEFQNLWAEQLPARTPIDPEAAKAGEGRGFVLFRRGLENVPGVWDGPRANELLPTDQPIELTMAGGESESVVFTLHALRDLPEVNVRAAYIDDNPYKSSIDRVAAQMVRYKFKNIGFSGAGVYGSVPWLLVDAAPVAVPAGTNRTFCVTVHARAGRKGVHQVEITIRAGGGTLRIPVRVRLLDVTLPDADMGLSLFGVGGTAPYFSYFPENADRNRQDQDRSLAFARHMGLTQATIGGLDFRGFVDGRAQFDATRAQAEHARAKEHGFPFIDLHPNTQGLLSQAIRDKGELAKRHGFVAADDLVKELFGAAIRQAKDAGLPEPLFGFGDEPPETVAPEFIEMHRRLRDLAGGKSYICWSPHGPSSTNLIDVTSVCSLNVAKAEHFERVKKAGNTLYLNNQGMNRWAFGLYSWRAQQAGAQIFQQFAWIGTHGDAYYPLDSSEDDGGAAYPDRDGNLRPIPRLLAVREGIDDYRYLLALMRATDPSRTLPEPERRVAQEARAYVDEILGRIRFEDTARDRRPQMTEAELNAFRAKVQDYLGRL